MKLFSKILHCQLYRKIGLFFILPIFIFIICFDFSYSQNINPTTDTLKTSQTQTQEKDTLLREKPLTKSPMGAVWRSIALPGWGQIYVDNYWKAPIFLLGGGACVYLIVWNNNRYQKYQTEYNSFKLNYPNDKSGLDLLNRQKEYYRDNRDKSYFFLGITYVLAAIDAYVGAYLFDFEVDENIGVRISPYYRDNAGLTFSLKLK